MPLAGPFSIQVGATDSGLVVATVVGGKFPLVARGGPAAARAWATAAASFPAAIETNRPLDFGHNSDLLRLARKTSDAGHAQGRSALSVVVGPNELVLFHAEVTAPTRRAISTAMLRASGIAEPLARRTGAYRTTGTDAASVRATAAPLNDPAPIGAAQRCLSASSGEPIEYNFGPHGYPAGTDFNRVLEPDLLPGAKPDYPAEALGARVTGVVPATFAVDSTGTPLGDTFRLTGPTNPLFLASVCEALPRMRFSLPPTARAASVRLVRKTFRIPPPDQPR